MSVYAEKNVSFVNRNLFNRKMERKYAQNIWNKIIFYGRNSCFSCLIVFLIVNCTPVHYFQSIYFVSDVSYVEASDQVGARAPRTKDSR